MSYDLFVWPADRAISADDAWRLSRGWESRHTGRGPSKDARLEAFAAQLTSRFPGVLDPQDAPTSPVFELDVHDRFVHLGIPWAFVTEVASAAQRAAIENGLLVFDPQERAVHLPPPFGDGQIGRWDRAQDRGEQRLDGVIGRSRMFRITGDRDEDIRRFKAAVKSCRNPSGEES